MPDMVPVDERHAVVDLATGDTIKHAVAVDVDAGDVVLREPTYEGPVDRMVHYPAGIRIVRRR